VARLALSRRSFLKSSAAAAAVPFAGPWGWRTSPAETLNVACIGVGGMGGSDLQSVASGKNVRIAALCDVDAGHLDAAAKAHDGARRFRDFRRLLDEMGHDVDAVVVSTPDHMHGSIAIAAMQLGKHVYCQKPLAHNLHECRLMTELAKSKGVVTQMGTQIHAHQAYRTAVATLRAGVIGKVQRAHSWVSRSWAGPAEGRPARKDPVPDELDWDLWLGVAAERPFVRGLYHPTNWRGWVEFGTGTLGDMGCHIFDPVFTALDLLAPRTVTAHGAAHRVETFAPDQEVRYTFAGTPATAETFELRWTDGRVAPDRAQAQLPAEVALPDSGSFLVGDKGVMVLPHWSMPTLWHEGEKLDAAIVERPAGDHYHEWTDACRGEGQTSTPFAYAGPLTEAVLLGTLAGRFPDRTLRWDSGAARLDARDADALVTRSYRKGWEIP